jgi:predicted O-methyltransferase YrrM
MRRALLRSPYASRILAALALAALLLTWVAPALGWPLFGLVLLALLLLETARLRRAVAESRRELHALVQIRPLLGEMPVEVGGWSAEPLLLQRAVRLLVEHRPRLVVECGSGSSTVVLARCLRALGGRVVTLEHDPAWARVTSELLRLHGVADVASVVAAPLVARRTPDGRELRWYGPEYEPFLGEAIDFLLVDGPPKPSGHLARYPAVPLLQPFLSPRCVILLDDGDRSDERATARAWGRELPARVTYLEGGRGGWLLHRSP